MEKTKNERLTKREQQIMDIIYKTGQATASQLLAALPDPPSNSAVRSLITGLVKKNVLKKHQEGFKYIYYPVIAAKEAKRNALKDVLKTFYKNSPRSAFVELLDMSKSDMNQDDWDHLSDMVKSAKSKKEKNE